MPVYLDKDKGRWRFTFNRVIARSRCRASRLLPAGWSRAQAEKYDRTETARLYALATGVEREERLISEAVRLYVEHRLPQLKDGHKAGLHLAAMHDYYKGRGVFSLAKVAQDYVKAQWGKLAPGTIRNRLAYLKAACRYAWKHHDLCEHDPTAKMSIPDPDNDRHVYLRAAQVINLANACPDPDMAAIIRIAFFTGLRWIAEILPRRPQDVETIDGQEWLHVGVTKNGTPRMVPVHPSISQDLKRLPFKRYWRDYYAEFEIARAAVGLEHVTMHDLRHSLASAIISGGGTLPDVQGALHHKSVQSSKRYSHLYPDRLLAVILGLDTGNVPTGRRETEGESGDKSMIGKEWVVLDSNQRPTDYEHRPRYPRKENHSADRAPGRGEMPHGRQKAAHLKRA